MHLIIKQKGETFIFLLTLYDVFFAFKLIVKWNINNHILYQIRIKELLSKVKICVLDIHCPTSIRFNLISCVGWLVPKSEIHKGRRNQSNHSRYLNSGSPTMWCSKRIGYTRPQRANKIGRWCQDGVPQPKVHWQIFIFWKPYKQRNSYFKSLSTLPVVDFVCKEGLLSFASIPITT